MEEALDHRSVGLLGLVTICAYGSWFYAFGVLLDPILADTGWRESTLAASFSLGVATIGFAALFGGRLIDQVGHRVVFLLAAALHPIGLLTASFATDVRVFVLGAVIALGTAGSLGFYPVTMTVAVRVNPQSPVRAISVLTIWGAFASPIFLPMTSALVEWTGWRDTTRILAALATASFVVGALAVPLPRDHHADSEPPVPLKTVLATIVRSPAARWFTVATAFGGFSMTTMLVYQVPTMTAAGLSAGTAATFAGIRGFAQLGGRLPLARIVAAIGRTGGLMLAFGAMATAGLLLLMSGNIIVAAAFALVGGFGIGAFSPLQGMKAEELFDRANLGTTMGFYGSVLLIVGSLGPVTAGLLVDATGSRRWPAVLVCGAALLAIGAITATGRAEGPASTR